MNEASDIKQRYFDLPWHDAELRSLIVDRSSPGKRDTLELDVIWPDGESCRVSFLDCYHIDANLNFGVVPQETIYEASFETDDQTLLELRAKWGSAGVSLNDLYCFHLSTASTGSELRVYAKGFEVITV